MIWESNQIKTLANFSLSEGRKAKRGGAVNNTQAEGRIQKSQAVRNNVSSRWRIPEGEKGACCFRSPRDRTGPALALAVGSTVCTPPTILIQPTDSAMALLLDNYTHRLPMHTRNSSTPQCFRRDNGVRP